MAELGVNLELIDDVALMETLLNAADLDAEVIRELDGESSESGRLPAVLYDLVGSDEPGLVNGPGMWVVTLRVWVWGETDSDVWRTAKAVHRAVNSWDVPGNGNIPGVAGVERATTVQKFQDVWDNQLPTRVLRESNAQFELLLRSY